MVAGPEEAIAMRTYLTVLSGRRRGETIPITHSPFLIGRDPAADLRPASPSIGKQQCAILVDEGRALVQDFAHSTRLNEQPIEGAAELADGDCLQIGPLVFRFAVDRPQPAPDTPAAGVSSSDEAEAAAAALLLSMTEKPTRTNSAADYDGQDVSNSSGREPANAGQAQGPRGPASKRFEARPLHNKLHMASVYTMTETRPQHVVIHRQSGPRLPQGFRDVHASIEEATQYLRGLYLGYRITISDSER
jgi:predicted component of type VI protein secretion system